MIDYDPYDIETPGSKSISIHMPKANRFNFNLDDHEDHGYIAIVSSRRLSKIGPKDFLAYAIDREPPSRLNILLSFNPKGKPKRRKSGIIGGNRFYINEQKAKVFSTYLSKLSSDRSRAMMMSLDLGLFPANKKN